VWAATGGLDFGANESARQQRDCGAQESCAVLFSRAGVVLSPEVFRRPPSPELRRRNLESTSRDHAVIAL
jgi:hypothetical protein